ncbi:hypothetical protein [Magnetovibrio sp.]|uniref:hypothetical protein n=1 Tax=Magnetovibrio sp. TaxID=2024836 RepID=UPI002F95A7EC
MNWAHALLMAELLLKAAEKIDTVPPAANTKENTLMGDEAPIASPQPATVDPTLTQPSNTASVTATDQATQAQIVEPPAASVATQSIIANAVEQPVSSPTSAELHQSISDLVRLAQILDANPDLFDFLKSLTAAASASKG